MIWNHLFIHCLLFTIIYLIAGSTAIRLVNILVPKVVKPGHDVRLVCNYILDGDSLYTLKWHLNAFEFYRYAPRDTPQKQVFPLNAIIVDLNASNNGTAVLRNVKFTASGRYKCEISAEGSFRTIEKEADMRVSVAGSSSRSTLSSVNDSCNYIARVTIVLIATIGFQTILALSTKLDSLSCS